MMRPLRTVRETLKRGRAAGVPGGTSPGRVNEGLQIPIGQEL